ncbi:DNA mismatch repair protein MutT [Acrocarpospora phusangensis]|uniref:DNA mismatch repair protein MutT n=1 Tax=Acrocarpospora phusangensis TaxID=1070424 RepID=A0A919Q8P1_9ACTN|nr:NUDIX domain-containing protein [Acrocarpospora phusangensis]GIH24236.1 DNA mismatch repair protein MutT [Acrocarpospora phusangensis]
MADAIFRPSARVLLVDEHERVLLFRAADAWYTPGGGVRPAEDAAVAAARELREETGHVIAPGAVGPVVAVSSGHWSAADGTLYRAEDSFFLVRATGLRVDISGMEEFESNMYDSFHWWTLAELRAATERVLPLGLADLLERLLRGDPPAREPVVLPWHEAT